MNVRHALLVIVIATILGPAFSQGTSPESGRPTLGKRVGTEGKVLGRLLADEVVPSLGVGRVPASLAATLITSGARARVDDRVDEFGFDAAQPGAIRVVPGECLLLTIDITGNVPAVVPRRLKHRICYEAIARFEMDKGAYVAHRIQRAREKILQLVKAVRKYDLELRPVVRDVERNVLYPNIDLEAVGYDPKQIPVAARISSPSRPR